MNFYISQCLTFKLLQGYDTKKAIINHFDKFLKLVKVINNSLTSFVNYFFLA